MTTHDEDQRLANEVQNAVDHLNRALGAAGRAGLIAKVDVQDGEILRQVGRPAIFLPDHISVSVSRPL